jgi:radical SAM superfamily enzyme YgiQ (UPF0313 family)
MVADELAELEGRGARHVSIVDSVFNSSPTHVVETCEAILRRGVRIKWSCFLRPQGLTAGHMSLMARAGLTHVEFGSDSFSDRVLQSYGKNLRFDEIRQASELAAGEGLEQCHFLILGGPGESKETIEETLANSRSLHGVIVLPVVGMRVYPGTSLHARAVSEGIIREDSDLLEPCHYVAPGLTAEFIFDRLAEIARTDRNWIVGDPPASFHELVERLRRRGIAGPLWTYFTVLQRLAPPPAGSAAPRTGRSRGVTTALGGSR